jgi:hypothetical protein
LQTQGIEVLRFWNNDVLTRTVEILEEICRHLPSETPSPRPLSPPAGEGSKALTFSGIGCYRPALFADIVKGHKARLAPLLKVAMDAGSVTGAHFSGRWEDVGTPARLAALDVELTEQTGATS